MIKNDVLKLVAEDAERFQRTLVILHSAEKLEDIVECLVLEEGWTIEEVMAFIVTRCFSGFNVKKLDGEKRKEDERNEEQLLSSMYLLRFFEFV